MPENEQQLHAVVHGYVQGVSFRYYTEIRANELGLCGWVRNLPERTVEVVAEGPRSQLEKLLLFLHTGPSSARVTRVDVDWGLATGRFRDFRIH